MEDEEQTPGAVLQRGFVEREAAGADGSVQIYYEVLRLGAAGQQQPRHRILMVMGYAALGAAWYPTLVHLQRMAEEAGASYEVLLLDNRGIGRSSKPAGKQHYSTLIMAQDALAAMDAVGWPSADVVGFSMGGMIATQLAAAAPQRVASLCIIGVSGGGFNIVPRSVRAWRYALRSLRARSDEQNAKCALKFHFMRETLHAPVAAHATDGGKGAGSAQQRLVDVLMPEYVAACKKWPQDDQGVGGQAHTCFKHRVTPAMVQAIRAGGFPVCFLHGRKDLVALPKMGAAQAKKLGAPLYLLHAGHFVPRERASETCALMLANMERRCCKPEEDMVVAVQGQPSPAAAATAVTAVAATGGTAAVDKVRAAPGEAVEGATTAPEAGPTLLAA